VTVDPNGRSGGLALFYNNEYQVQILYSSNRMIDVEAVALGKKNLSYFCVWRTGAKIEGTSVGTVDEVWVIENRPLVHYWRFKRDYRKS